MADTAITITFANSDRAHINILIPLEGSSQRKTHDMKVIPLVEPAQTQSLLNARTSILILTPATAKDKARAEHQ